MYLTIDFFNKLLYNNDKEMLMIDLLTEEQIIEFIEKYGDGDIFYSFHRGTDGTIIIKYLPNFTKFADESNIDAFKKELKDHPHLKERYLSEIILTNAYAYIPNNDHSAKNPLVKNYKKFLEDIKAKYSRRAEYCKPENIKDSKRNKHNDHHHHRGR